MMDQEVLFLSGVIPNRIEDYIISNSKISVEFAADKYQKSLIQGMRNDGECALTVLNSVFIASFPRGFRKAYVPPFTEQTSEQSNQYHFINTGFLNLWGIRHFFKFHALVPHVKQWLRSTDSTKKTVMGYSIFSPTFDVCKMVKQKSTAQTCIIIPDMPEFCYGESKIYNVYLRKSHDKLLASMKYIDKYVLLTSHMAERVNLPQKRYIIIEGICENKEAQQKCITEPKHKKKLLYTGALMIKYGIVNLLEAFHSIYNENYQLELCGDGDAVPQIQRMCQSDPRIVFSGRVSNETALQKQRDADILINPRQASGEYTEYSFPSKTMEYLLSATPMIGYKLAGIPDEYDAYIQYVPDNSIDALSATISAMCDLSKEELFGMGSRSRMFVQKNKNQDIQAKRLLDFLNDY
jgi:glycosyltransferase involved in cell wall biosynthesis